MKFPKSILIFSVFLSCVILHAQSDARQWRFGKLAGLDFTSNPPTQVINSALSTIEGCASISDGNGNLLFYTDGTKIWDQTNNIMANGNGLLGNGPSYTSQAALIVKQPQSQNLYYVFTLDDIGGINGLMYNLVDMSLAAGMGSVTTKNVQLSTPSCEKLAAINHCNGNDVWILTHDVVGNDFRAFLLSTAGISTVPVISTFPNTGISYLIGAMKISPDGRKVVLAAQSTTASATTGGFELYDFDNSTGILSNRIVLATTNFAYGCEFSPDSKKVYGTMSWAQTGTTTTTFGRLVQWDLCVPNSSLIANTQFTLNGNSLKHGMQLGTDGKLYLTNIADNSLSIVNFPNNLAAACAYSELAMPILTGSVQLALPNFNSSQFRTHSTGSITASSVNCFSYSFNFDECGLGMQNIVNMFWQFGDPLSGTSNTSTLSNPVHVFSGNGTYTIKLIKSYNCYNDTITKVIQIAESVPVLTVQASTAVCLGNTVQLLVTGANSYSWSNGQTTASISISPPSSTTISVIGTNTVNSCSAAKIITISVSKCTKTPEEIINERLLVYPNPAVENFTISCAAMFNYCMVNIFGEPKICENRFNDTYVVGVTNLEPGIYFLKCEFTNHQVSVIKLIKN